MTPDERLQRHEDWLHEHENAIAVIDARIRIIIDLQESTTRAMRDLTENLNRLTERIDRYISGVSNGRQS